MTRSSIFYWFVPLAALGPDEKHWIEEFWRNCSPAMAERIYICSLSSEYETTELCKIPTSEVSKLKLSSTIEFLQCDWRALWYTATILFLYRDLRGTAVVWSQWQKSRLNFAGLHCFKRQQQRPPQRQRQRQCYTLIYIVHYTLYIIVHYTATCRRKHILFKLSAQWCQLDAHSASRTVALTCSDIT